MKFSLIIPTKDRNNIINETLSKLLQVQEIKKQEVLIINDASTFPDLQPEFGFVKMYQNPASGVASGRNFGALLATNHWFIFMDDDMWVQPETFKTLAELNLDPACCYNLNWVYPKEIMCRYDILPFLRYLHRYGFDSLEGWSRDVTWQQDKPFRVKGITSQFLVIHRSTFERVGGYNTSFPFAGFEDHDLSARLRQFDIPVIVDPRNLIFHNEADRIDLQNWLERKWRGAVTRRVGVHLGYKELELNYSPAKHFFYKTVFACRKPLIWLLHHWWRSLKPLDHVYFLLVSVMLGTYSCMGYTGMEAQKNVAALKDKP